ncbi:hypothetical protein ACFU5O_03795 [Streptomyces sp. NPDC057445]
MTSATAVVGASGRLPAADGRRRPAAHGQAAGAPAPGTQTDRDAEDAK